MVPDLPGLPVPAKDRSGLVVDEGLLGDVVTAEGEDRGGEGEMGHRCAVENATGQSRLVGSDVVWSPIAKAPPQVGCDLPWLRCRDHGMDPTHVAMGVRRWVLRNLHRCEKQLGEKALAFDLLLCFFRVCRWSTTALVSGLWSQVGNRQPPPPRHTHTLKPTHHPPRTG